MPWAFQGINTLSSALEAFQTQIDVTGENIANVNTPGYVQQSVNLQEANATPVTEGKTVQIGSGVSVDSVTNIQNAYLELASFAAASDLGRANMQSQTLSSVNSVVADPNGSGLATQIDQMFGAWSSLASSSSNANKLGVQQAAQTLADSLNNTYSGLESIKSTANQQVSSLLKQVQKDVNDIAQLNLSINKSKLNGSSPNELMDQRDQAVSNLSSLVNVTVDKSSDGTYTVSTGNLVLVDQTGARNVPTGFDPSTGSLTTGSGKFPVTSGQVSGLMDSISKIDSYESTVDTLATQIGSAVNSAYSKAVSSTGQKGSPFFTGSVTNGTFGLASSILSSPSTIATGVTGNASDTGVAKQIANLSTTSIAGLGGQTPSGFYGELVGQIGSDGQNANSAQSTQQALSTQVAAQVQSVSGVSLDAEMSNLMRYQSSYQAAAQALSGMDQSIQTLLTTVR